MGVVWAEFVTIKLIFFPYLSHTTSGHCARRGLESILFSSQEKKLQHFNDVASLHLSEVGGGGAKNQTKEIILHL